MGDSINLKFIVKWNLDLISFGKLNLNFLLPYFLFVYFLDHIESLHLYRDWEESIYKI